MSKLVTVTSDLNKLKHPLQSSLLILGTNQWFLMDILIQWEGINEKYPQFIRNALSIVQTKVSLNLSCIQAQLWMQSMTMQSQGKVKKVPYSLKFKRYFGITLFSLKINPNPGGI